MQTDNNEGKWKTMNMEAWIGPILCSLQTIIPTVIVVCFGANVVELILEVIPEWVTNGLSIAAGMLPVVGIGMLMRYMPLRNSFRLFWSDLFCPHIWEYRFLELRL